MKVSSALLTLLFAVSVLVISLYFTQQNNSVQKVADHPDWLAELKTEKADLNRIEIYTKQNQLLVDAKLENSVWVAANMANYPLQVKPISAWFNSVLNAKNVEPKTNNAEKFYKLGLDDPSLKTTMANSHAKPASLVKLTAGKSYHLLLGNFASSGQGQYVRRQDSHQTWLLNQQINLPTSIMDWINPSLFTWTPEQVDMISVHQVITGEQFKIERHQPKAELLLDQTETSAQFSDVEDNQADASQFEQTNVNWYLTPLTDNQTLKSEQTVIDFIQNLADIEFLNASKIQADVWQSEARTLVQIGFQDDSLLSLNLLASDQQYWLRVMSQGSGEIATHHTQLSQWQFEISAVSFEQINLKQAHFLESQSEQKISE
ncbi:DUF4340 domain-containing protein [Catenovulum adriaticum]|uniref:DUF4340 domain-containing protein n=1 Tax=Catenovulum adriaticum TaxID=2984846 RepID=A0ABY7AHZ6_9ALTE|nr:DUF4340 domain-containing protein [Catenovulum sp. TS8]WAJ69238.1 DUF4340 domain-containing protein [Catenovulum sp. TS8]